MEAQRKRVRSCNPAERLAAALLIPAELSRRLRLLGNSEIAQLLDDEVCGNMSILAPEATVCVEAALRLRAMPKTRFVFCTRNGNHLGRRLVLRDVKLHQKCSPLGGD
jgi:hypothetical protein